VNHVEERSQLRFEHRINETGHGLATDGSQRLQSPMVIGLDGDEEARLLSGQWPDSKVVSSLIEDITMQRQS
jgi:hypothetical protein